MTAAQPWLLQWGGPAGALPGGHPFDAPWLAEYSPLLTLALPVLPLLAALAIWLRSLLQAPPQSATPHGVFALDAHEAFPRRISFAALAGALAAWLGLLLQGLAGAGGVPPHAVLWDWLPGLQLSILFDPLAALCSGLILLGGVFGLNFASRYLHRETAFERSFAALNLFLGGMLLIAVGGSAWLAFAGWELIGVASFLLIAYNRLRPAATGNALYAFLSNRIGDAAFLAALGFAAWQAGSLEWPQLLQRVGGMESVAAALVIGGLVVAALVKSGSVPFSPWIARALEGPTPTSALFYGSLLLHAGIMLLLRISPVLLHIPELAALLVLCGLATTLYAQVAAWTATDIKRSLLLSAQTQVGLMLIGCGIGATEWVTFHLAAHSVFRLWQFLQSPDWLRLEPDAVQTPEAPAWARRWPVLHSAGLHRFWIDKLGDALLVAPTQRLSRDMIRVETRLIAPALGEPGELPPLAEQATATAVPARAGLSGWLLHWIAARLQAFERRLLIQQSAGHTTQHLRDIGAFVSRIEAGLQEPRYLFLFIMATLVVIL